MAETLVILLIILVLVLTAGLAALAYAMLPRQRPARRAGPPAGRDLGSAAGHGRGTRRPSGRACPRAVGAARLGLEPARLLARDQHQADGRPAAAPARAPRGHRPRAEEFVRAVLARHLAARRARQQAGARRLRAGAHGSDRAGQPAQGIL